MKTGIGMLRNAIQNRAGMDKSHQLDAASRLNYAKTYTVEHSMKVLFTGHMDETNVERLLCGDPAWERSDTGEDIPVIMEDQPYLSFSCRCRRFQLLEKHAMSNNMMALLALPSGLLMSGSFVWLNKRMDLYEQSPIMDKVLKPSWRGIMLTVVDRECWSIS
jgi:hypothetical protein